MRTGAKADNRRGQYIKPPKSRTGVEPRTGGHLQPAHSTPEREGGRAAREGGRDKRPVWEHSCI